jgi:ribosomal protein S18 acetylase RimI-like enzyme
MNYRKYQPHDKSNLITLWEEVFPDAAPHNQPARVIEEKLKVDDLVFVAEKDGQILGACQAGYDGHRGWLYGVAVSPQHRRKGIGTALVKAAIEALREIGCGKVNLQIRAGNTPVADFYQTLGFEVEDRLSMGRHL